MSGQKYVKNIFEEYLSCPSEPAVHDTHLVESDLKAVHFGNKFLLKQHVRRNMRRMRRGRSDSHVHI